MKTYIVKFLVGNDEHQLMITGVDENSVKNSFEVVYDNAYTAVVKLLSIKEFQDNIDKENNL